MSLVQDRNWKPCSARMGTSWTLRQWMPAGATYRSEAEGQEVAIVLLGGLANTTVGETEFLSIGSRATVFSGRATTLFVPPGQKWKLEAVGTVDACVDKVPSDLAGEPRLIGPEKVKVSTRATDACERTIHDILDPSFPSKYLLIGETFNQPAKWSSYPPEKHDTMNPSEETRMEEVYLFKLNPPQGFGFQRVYSPERKIDETFVIKDNSLVKLPYGYHPVVAAPGYALYYLWIVAGQPRNYTLHDDPDYKWVKEL